MISDISFYATDNQMIIGQVKNASDISNLLGDIIRGKTTIPFGNRQALKHLQDLDPILSRVRELLLAGEGPHPNEKLKVKRYMQKNVNISIAK